MNTIYKYQLAFGADGYVNMPLGAEVLSVQMQGRDLCVWASVCDTNPAVPRYFAVIGTGHEVPMSMMYVGSVQDGPFVWHVFTRD